MGDFSFLRSLNPTALGKRVQKEKSLRGEKPVNLKPVKNDDEDEYSDEAELSETIGETLNASNNDKPGWEAEQPYEQKPRTGDSQWRKKDSTRLPIRSTSGKLLQMATSDSDSDSDSYEAIEESDIESDVDGPQEQSTVEVLIMDGPEAVIDAKETLAKLAEEIVESPEEKVFSLN